MALDDDTFYSTQHWEILIGTIIDRIGLERFLDMTAYVLNDQKEGMVGAGEITGAIERLAAAVRTMEI